MTQSLHHSDIERIVAALDARYDMLDVRVKGYCLWPTIKVQLWRYLMNTFVADQDDSPQSFVPVGRFERLKRYMAIMPQSFLFLVRGLMYQRRYGHALPTGAVVLLYAGRVSRDPQGQALPNYFGNIVHDTGIGPAIAINDSGTFNPPPAPILASQYFRAKTFIRMAIKLGLRLYPAEFYTGVRTFITRMQEHGQGCERCPQSALWLAAAHFLESRAVYTHFFKKTAPRILMITDFDAHFGVVAAARDCGIPVYDMQHGTFWSKDLDHSWTGAQCSRHLAALPFPDQLLVFGKFWQNIAQEQGLWSNDNVKVVGAPVMEKYLPLRKNPQQFSLPRTPTVLYLSGDIRPLSVAKWLDDFLSSQPAIRLRIRLHPREMNFKNAYQFLAEKYPAHVTFSQMAETTLNDILNADIVIGTSTTAMIEALMLGVPVLSLGSGATPEGIGKNHQNDLLQDLIPHAATPADLKVMLQDMQVRPDFWQEHLKKVEKLVFDFYAPNYEQAMKNLISERIAS